MTETDKKNGKSGKGSGDTSPAKNRSKKGRSKKGVVGWVSMLTFVSVWMFVLGVLVGRGTVSIDSFGFGETMKIAEEIKKGASFGKIGPRSTRELPENPDLDFYRELKSSAEPSFEKRKNVKKRERKIVLPAEMTGPPAAGTTSPDKKEPKKVTVASASKTNRPAAVLAEPPKKSMQKNGGKYTIQVAALKETGVAREAVAKLKKKGYDSYFIKAHGKDGGLWFRIRIGSYMDRKDATGTLLRLKRDKIDGFLVNK